MTIAPRRPPRFFRPLGLAIASLIVVTGCAMEAEVLPVAGAIIIGTTDEIGTLDPAGVADRGALLVMANVYPHLLTTVADSSEPVPDIASSAEFTSPTEYTVVLKAGLTFANGNALTASDVKFSLDRLSEIAVENGPASLFENVTAVEAPDDTTVVFTLSQPNDELWPVILSSPAAAIVDEEVFSKNGLTDNRDIIKGQGFGGPYTIETFREKDLIQFKANPNYEGVLGEPETDTINLRYFGNGANLMRAIRSGDIDLSTRGFASETLKSIAYEVTEEETLVVHTVPGGELRYLAIDPADAPFGTSTAEPDAAKALAVRHAIADLIDRKALVEELYVGAYEPLYSFAPSSVRDGSELAAMYGGADGAPDTMRATTRFRDAGITPPVALSIHYSAERYGALADEELAAIMRQLTQGGLFAVELFAEGAEGAESDDESATGAGVPVFAGTYFPTVFDAESYLVALFGSESVLGDRFTNVAVETLAATPTGGDTGATRVGSISEAIDTLADELPIIPLLQSNHVLVANSALTGVEAARDGSLLLRFSSLRK